MHGRPSDEVMLRLFGKLVEMAFVVVPDEIRLHPRALAAYRRASGRVPADAPLVEAPRSRRRRGTAGHADALRAARQVTGRARRFAGAHHVLAWRVCGRRAAA